MSERKKKNISREAASLITEQERGLKTTLKTLGKVKDEGSALAAKSNRFFAWLLSSELLKPNHTVEVDTFCFFFFNALQGTSIELYQHFGMT